MDALTALKTRRSIRTFSGREVSEAHIREMVDCARQAATARNEQPWEFVVIREPGLRQQISVLAEHGKFIAQAPVCLAVFCRETKYYLEDGAAATQNILVAAHALGLGSCWVAGDKKAYAEPIRRLLEVPGGFRLVSLVAVGYPADTRSPVVRKRGLDEVLHWEKY